MGHGPRIEGKNRHHVSNIKLKKCFVEKRWVWLEPYELNNLRNCLAEVKTLHDQQFSQSDLVNFDFVNWLVIVAAKFLVLVLNWYHSIVIILAMEIYVVFTI